MKRTIATALSLLTAIVLLGLSTIANAEEMYLVRDGKKIEKNMVPVTWLAKAMKEDPNRWKSHTVRKGTTVDGIFVLDKRPQNMCHFEPIKSALGDCEFTMVFRSKHGDYGDRGGGRGPFIYLVDRARIGGWAKGSQFIVWDARMSLALKPFKGPATVNINDGKLHAMSVKRVGDVLTFTVDGKKINEQKIDPDVNLIFQMQPSESRPDFAMIKMTAEKFSDKLKTDFKSAAPIEEIFKGTEPSHEYGKAASYRIPALAVSTKGTILAFAEARRLNRSDVGDVDAVLRRSEDNGKTWGPEIVIMDAKEHSVNNPCPVVDSKTGRIWLFMARNDLAVLKHGWQPQFTRHFLAYSDDDGKTWTKPRDITKIIHEPVKGGPDPSIQGPGAGFVMQRGKHKGRLIMPSNYNYAGKIQPGVIYSDDNGKTWKLGGSCRSNPSTHLIEGNAAELCDGSVLFSCRTANKVRGMTIIPDGGTKDTTKFWYAKDVPDPHCQGAIVRYSWPKDGKPGLIVYSGPGVDRGRLRGTLRGSYDDGKTWPYKRLYYEGGSGYSDVNVLPDGRLIVLFEKDGKHKLGFTVLPAPPATLPGKINE